MLLRGKAFCQTGVTEDLATAPAMTTELCQAIHLYSGSHVGLYCAGESRRRLGRTFANQSSWDGRQSSELDP